MSDHPDYDFFLKINFRTPLIIVNPPVWQWLGGVLSGVDFPFGAGIIERCFGKGRCLHVYLMMPGWVEKVVLGVLHLYMIFIGSNVIQLGPLSFTHETDDAPIDHTKLSVRF